MDEQLSFPSQKNPKKQASWFTKELVTQKQEKGS